MSSTICPRFSQNAWKKDLCSNCYRSKEEHKAAQKNAPKAGRQAIPVPPSDARPQKSAIRPKDKKSRKTKLTFAKELAQVIGSVEWSDFDSDDESGDERDAASANMTDNNNGSQADDEHDAELEKLTKVNTNFNMQNGNLLGDAEQNIKRTFAAAQLGKPAKDGDGKKQTLKISVMPFGGPVTTNKVNDIRQKFAGSTASDEPTKMPVVLKTIIKPGSTVEYVTEELSPKERPAEKSLLDEISETLARQSKEQEDQANKIKFDMQQKRSLSRHNAIVKDQTKPKISVFSKNSDSDSLASDNETASGYYDVVEASSRYENVTDDYKSPHVSAMESSTSNGSDGMEIRNKHESSFFSNHLISEMFSGGSGASGKNGRNYNFMSQITSDGLIVTKSSSDDANDSNGSSFDYATSSDEELSMNRSESDSGIGICVATSSASSTAPSSASPSSSTSSSTKSKKASSQQHTDYEDIQVQRDEPPAKPYLLTKSREMAGEPDGSADPDGSEAAPALPSSSPPPLDDETPPTPRISFLSTAIQSNVVSSMPAAMAKSPVPGTKSKTDKPAVPVKPTVSIIKAFVKRSPNQADVISELQSKIKGDRPATLSLLPVSPTTKTPPAESPVPAESTQSDAHHTPAKSALKKSRAPDPPTPTAEEAPSPHYENVSPTAGVEKPRNDQMVEVSLAGESAQTTPAPPKSTAVSKADAEQYSFLYTRNPTGSVSKSSSPVIREKDKRERATINPKFRSLNTFSSQYKQQQQLQQPVRSTTPEPAPRKSLSMSQDCLANNGTDDKKKKSKFSIKKFLRINTGSSSSSNSSASKAGETLFDKRDLLGGKHRMHVAADDAMPPESPNAGHPSAKPRLVIIHPIDINTMEVEVVKEMSKVNEIVTGKPPAPPLRKGLDANAHKPSRPPPPKSAEVRRKQLKLTDSPGSLSLLAHKKPLQASNSGRSEDSVYANLGEIRSAIAPRKPERTASMREREAQLEIARKRLSKFQSEEDETDAEYAASLLLTPASSAQSTLDRCELKMSAGTLESRKSAGSTVVAAAAPASVLGEGIKTSIQKMNNTIDSYLKDKRGSDEVSTTGKTAKPQPPATPLRSSTLSLTAVSSSSASPVRIEPTTPTTVEIRSTSVYESIALQAQSTPVFAKQSQRSSLPDQSQCYQAAVLNGSPAPARSSPAAATGYCRSDIVGPGTRYQSQSMANIAQRPLGGGGGVSRSYCGSELSDFDIYAPYSFYGPGGDADALNAGADDTVSMWSSATGANATGGLQLHQQMKQRPANRLRMRKGRSVVHKNLEDNYGAVVVANHEALAQVLEQLQQTVTIAPQLRPLAHSINLRFDDFAILEGVRGVVAGRRAFHPAIWAHQTHVTLALSVDCGQMSDMSAITEFCDLVPSHYLPLMPTTERQMVQATISVLPRMFVDTLQSFGQMLRIRSDSRKYHHPAFGGSTINLSEQHGDHRSSNHSNGSTSNGGLSTLRAGQSVQNLSTFHEYPTLGEAGDSAAVAAALPGMPSFDDLLCREVGFVLLQLVNGLKSVQAKGIEQLPMSLSNVILSRELEPNKDAQAKLFVLHGLNQDASRGEDDEPMGTLCQCAHAALTELLPRTKITPTLEQILVRDRSESLSKTKAVLEFALWGPVDVDLTAGGGRERELALQRWLDLERATVLHGLIRSRVELSAYDECHLMFLVRSSAKTMCEASSILSGISDSD